MQQNVRELKKKISRIILLLRKEFPGVNIEKDPADPLDVLIATILSQNTTDKTSYRAFMNLKNNFKNWDDVLSSPVKKVKDAIRVCGLANQKSEAIRSMLKKIKSKHGKLSLDFIKEMDDNEIYRELLQYKGVGVKTVSCVLIFSLGRDVCPVDTHVHRVTNRLGIVSAKTPDKTFQQLQEVIPAGKKYLLHVLLIKFGRKICRSNNPFCNKCVLYDLCEFKDKEHYAEINSLSKIEPKDNDFIIMEHI